MTALAPDTFLLAALLTPAAAALLIPFANKNPNLRESITLLAAALLAVIVWLLLPAMLAGARPAVTALEILPGLSLTFAIEPLGMLFALVAGSLWLVNSIYSIGYMRANKESRQTVYYTCFAIAITATMWVAFAGNLFTLFLGYELLTLSTYPLVTHKGTPEAMRAGRVYLGLLIGTSMTLLLPAIIITGLYAGTLDFATGGILSGKLGAFGLGLLLALYAFGIGKAALMPFHFWLPAAMVAPTPVSALLHAVAVVKAGVFTLLKVIVYIFGIDPLRATGAGEWLSWIAAFTIITASIIALRQNNLKRCLAYSTVSQLSYVVLAASLFTPAAAVGAAMHIAGHAVSKITLFFAAGAIYTVTHKTEISELDGIGRCMPWTMGAFAVGAVAMIGLPPTAGFLGKWFILQGASQASHWLAIAVVITSTALNAAYFLPIVYRAFLLAPEKPEPGNRMHGEAPWPIVAALTVTAVATVVLFLQPNVPLALARLMAGAG
jgi:multicomponent Na+:H+ antiporter subunit D